MPNFFDYAKNESSQDDFVCWLSSWANPAYSSDPLHATAKYFLDCLYKKAGIEPPSKYNTVDVYPQYGKKQDKIDVFLVINKTDAIIIENKVDSNVHSNQLVRYYEAIKKENKYKPILCIYLKTREQSDYGAVISAGYELFNRASMLDVLTYGKEHGVKNDIFEDYSNHLFDIEYRIKSYSSLCFSDWSWEAWTGFFVEIQKTIKGGWGYVANPSGGFLGFWWHWKGFSGFDAYLQLEQEKLCFKIAVADKANQQTFRNKCHHDLMANCESTPLQITKPKRLGTGKTMTVAIIDDYRKADPRGILDLKKTLEVLHEAEKYLNAVSGGW